MPATHARRQIREAVQAALTGLDTTADRVFTGRPWPLQEGELPGIVIVIPSESVIDDGSAFGDGAEAIVGRQASLIVLGYDQGEDIEDRLDQIALEVETAMAADPTFGGLVKDSELAGSSLAVDGDGRKRAGEIRLTYTVWYRTTRGDPATALA